ncbi:MAG: hypothetical protein UX91_C0015G0016 [Candidatus Amesbacteria bacterium GW2011_GWB1_47_19]|nr:MAG: hypothetical protein UX91_C0015G0016 [Candidatus Amesbacteria bacterium GW2011_GWB1_47_19]
MRVAIQGLKAKKGLEMNDKTELIKIMAGSNREKNKICFFLSENQWLRARDLGWFNFTDSELASANTRGGFIKETQGCLLYVEAKVKKL